MFRFDLGNILTGVVAFLLLLLTLLYAAGLAAQRDVALAEIAELRAKIAAADAEARRKALKTERRYADEARAAAEQTKQELERVNEINNRVVADLEHDNVRLRAHWQGCVATNDLSRTAEAAARADENARLRNADTGNLIGTGAECDALIRAHQRHLNIIYNESE